MFPRRLFSHPWQKVKLENGKTVAMSELQKGDIVHSGIVLRSLNFSHLKIQLGARDGYPPSQSQNCLIL